MGLISKICNYIVTQSEIFRENIRIQKLKQYNINGHLISSKVEFKNIQNVFIGEKTYMNSGQLHAGEKARIQIGKNCAIGYDVHIKSLSHNRENPTTDYNNLSEKDIIIGDNVWIGDRVFIKEGITIGNNVIIGANSVVTKNIEANSVVGGCPAKKIQ